MSWLEQKYINMMGGRLERFSKVNNKLYRFRCPVCGDSKTNKFKTRGYIYERKGNYSFHCHNCSASMRLDFFIKKIDPTLYLEYIKEKLADNKPEPDPFFEKMKRPKFIKTTGLSKLKKISQLDPSHPAKKYVESRKIPVNKHYKLFYAPKFKQWVNEQIPGKLGDKSPEEPRLIIPFISKEGELIGFQGRSFRPDAGALRYITIMLRDDFKVFGIDTVNVNETIYCVEGPIDSLFIDNAIAVCGSDISQQLELTELPKEGIVVVYDNEPRNVEIVKKIEKTIEKGYNVCIWPTELQHKDVNDMVMAGFTPEEVKEIIDNNTHKGLEAKLFFAIWRKDR